MTRISATGRKNRKPTHNKNRGFTLIEILTVLVIVAVMAGLLVIGFSDSPQRRLRREASDLAALINAASDEAVMRGVEIGLTIDERGYRFVYFDIEKKQWQPVVQRGLAEHQFDEPLTVDVVLDSEHIGEDEQARQKKFAERSEDTALRPMVLILSSGEITPFTLTLSDDTENKISLEGDGLNPVTVQKS